MLILFVFLTAACSNSNAPSSTQNHAFQGVWTGTEVPTACVGDTLLCSILLTPPPLTGPVSFNVQHTNATASAIVTMGNFVMNSPGSVANNVLTLNASPVATVGTSSASILGLTATITGNQLQGTLRYTLGAGQITANLQNVFKQ